MGRLEDFRKYVLENLRSSKVYTAVIVVLVLLLPALFLTSYLVLGLLAVATLAVAWGVHYMNARWSGVELATFSTVLIGASMDPKTGAIAGFLLVTSQLVVGQWIGPYIFWVVPSYAVAGASAAVFSGVDIVTLGTSITVGLHVVFASMTAFTTPGRLGSYLPYAALNILFNFVLFNALATQVLALLG